MSTPDRYAILLRGINVGGRNPVSKTDLTAALESLSYTDVIIHLNSGNAVFSSETTPLQDSVQQALEARFGFDLPTMLLTGEQVKNIAAAIPETWQYNKPTSARTGNYAHVIYLFDAVNHEGFAEEIGYRPEIETCIYVPGALLHFTSQSNWTRSCLMKLMRKPAYAQVTVRNVNTARKLAELVDVSSGT